MSVASQDHPATIAEHGRLPEPRKISEQRWPADALPLVSVCCCTYKHEKYIATAIERFLMQETTFPVEIIVHDDASPDRTAEIVRTYQTKYPHLIRLIVQ